MIRLETKVLANKLAILGKAYSPKTSMPALQFLKFENGKMTVSDGNKTIITNIEYESINDNNNCDFKTLIPFKTLNDIVNKVNGAFILLEEKENNIALKCEKSHYKLHTMDIKEYPAINVGELENKLEFNSNEFKDIVKNVNFSCSTNEKKPILTGVNFKLENGNFNVVATDSFRLSKYFKYNDGNNTSGFNFTIASVDLANLLKIIPNDSVVSLNYDSTEIVFKFEDVIYKARLLAGQYPDTTRVIPTVFETICDVDRVALLSAIDRVSILSSNNELNFNVITLTFNKNEIIVSSSNNDIGNAKEYVDCKCDNEMVIACSGRYLIEALNSFEENQVKINLVAKVKPFTITSENKPNVIQLLLPIKID